MKKLIIVISLVGLLFFGCEEEHITGLVTHSMDTMNWQVSDMPRDFYPSMNLSDIEKQIVNNLYEGLTRVYDDQVHLAMAESIEASRDGLAYNIKLKTAQWSDGANVETNDFIYSWERDSNYQGEINLLYFDSYIDYVEVVDARHMIIHLTQANPDLLYQLSCIGFMPLRADVIDLDRSIPSYVLNVTNGPFVLEDYTFFTSVQLTKNIHYYDYYSVELDEINILYDNNHSDVYNEYKAGNYDLITGLSLDDLEYFIQNEDDFKILDKKGVYAYAINPDSSVLDNLSIRQILNLSIDRSELNPYNDYIEGSIAYSIFDEDVPEEFNDVSDSEFEFIFKGDLHNNNVTRSYADVDKVRSIIEDADLSLAPLSKLKILTRDNENDIRLAELLRTNWRENLGIYVSIDAKDRYGYTYALRTNDYDIALNPHYYIDYSPRHMLKFFFNSTINTTPFKNEEFDTKLSQLDMYDASNLEQIYNSLYKKVNDTSIIIPLFNIYEPVIITPEIVNWSRSHDDLFYFGNAKKIDVEGETLEDRQVNE